MSRVDIPKQDAQALNWVNTFVSVATANATLLNLTSGQTTNLAALATAFENAYEASETSKAATQGLVNVKNTMRNASISSCRSTAKVINANPNISNSLKSNLGISVTPSPVGPVVAPENLVAKGYDTGVNKLTWKRGGNGEGTIFGIEAKLVPGGSWTFVDFTTKTKFNHTGQTPGQTIEYRVYAKRDDVKSEISNVVVVYPDSETEVFTLKQAA